MKKEKIFEKYNKDRRYLGLKKLTKKQKNIWSFFSSVEKGKLKEYYEKKESD